MFEVGPGIMSAINVTNDENLMQSTNYEKEHGKIETEMNILNTASASAANIEMDNENLSDDLGSTMVLIDREVLSKFDGMLQTMTRIEADLNALKIENIKFCVYFEKIIKKLNELQSPVLQTVKIDTDVDACVDVVKELEFPMKTTEQITNLNKLIDSNVEVKNNMVFNIM